LCDKVAEFFDTNRCKRTVLALEISIHAAKIVEKLFRVLCLRFRVAAAFYAG
jgi:hypothetical protein